MSWDWKLSHSIAQRHFEATIPFLDSQYSGTDRAPQIKSVPDAVFSAINLIFSTEIYCKSIIAAYGGKPPQNHHLGKVYRKIRPEVRSILESSYHMKMEKYDSGGMAVCLEFYISSSEEFPENFRDDKPKIGSISEVLDCVGTTYNQWRYVFEGLSKEKPSKKIHFLHVPLRLLCESCDEYLSVAQATFKR